MIRANCINNTERVSGAIRKVFNQMGNFLELRSKESLKCQRTKERRRRRWGYKHERLTVEISDLLNYYRRCLLSEHGWWCLSINRANINFPSPLFILQYRTQSPMVFCRKKKTRNEKQCKYLSELFLSACVCVRAARVWIQYLFTVAGSKLKRVLFVITRKN